MKEILIGAGVLAALVMGFLGMSNAPVPTLQGTAGPEHTERQFFLDDVVVGGNNFATSSQGAATYTAVQIFNSKLITHTAGGALTATLPASSTIPQIPKVGDTKVVYLAPITTKITLAGGTGTELNTGSTTPQCLAGSLCTLTFVRQSDTDIEVWLDN